MKMPIVPIVIGAFGAVTKGPGGLGSWRTGRDYQNDRIIENGQNTEKSPGDSRRLAVTKKPVKDHGSAKLDNKLPQNVQNIT